MYDAIILEGIEFYGHHGVSDEEQEIGHRYSVDAILSLDLSQPSKTDNLNDTVSYSAAARLIFHEATTNRFRLLEKIASHLITKLFEEFSSLQSITITITKRQPPAKIIIENASVEMTRNRA